ncbi:MAG TPA: aminopeptidase P N-terminal domain-containing protein [Cytophagaceae bacterium]
MRYNPISKDLFINNRENLKKYILPGSIAVFTSNDVMPTNADGTMGFRQNSDLFYLSGIDQEDTILIVYPNSKNDAWQEVLFIKETNDHIKIWEGDKLTQDQARELSGVKTIYWTSQFESILNNLIFEVNNVYLNFNEHTRASKSFSSKEERLIKWFKKSFPLHTFLRASPILHQLRSIKSKLEIEQINQAIDITAKAFKRVLPLIKPGIQEYEIEAELTYDFLKNRSRGHAYAPIIAAGSGACVLHYISNNKECKDGDLLLMDVGCEYGNYASDLTRCVPVNGKFSARQREVYDSVLNVLKDATSLLIPGNTWKEYNEEVAKLMETELLKLKLLTKNDILKQDKSSPAYKKYFMHGASHYLGLDVHDVGGKYEPFQAGMVLTCEPGIYIREEGLGVRLENNILISDNGPINLMKNIPLEVEEIEELMNG